MARDYTKYVDPFIGTAETDLPPPEGIASTWFFIKAQVGNAHPGACLPFGMVSACAYSGAYPTGYGIYGPNTDCRPPRLFESGCASGFTHFHQFGTGWIGSFYNYLKAIPYIGAGTPPDMRWKLDAERAVPGYYSAVLRESGIRAELTVAPRAAWHRYDFAGRSDARVALDFCAGGLAPECNETPGSPQTGRPRLRVPLRTLPEEARIEIIGAGRARGYVKMLGIPIYAHIEAIHAGNARIWEGSQILGAAGFARGRISGDAAVPFGVVFDAAPESRGTVELRIGFSFRGFRQAEHNARADGSESFDETARRARGTWNDHLGRIRVAGGTEAAKTVFHTALYHSLIKPIDCTDESPFWSGSDCYLDFSTIWDQYKTQLPLAMTLCPERAAAMANTFIEYAERFGDFPAALLLDEDVKVGRNQSRALGALTISDALHRGIAGVDRSRALRAMVNAVMNPDNRDFIEEGIAHPYTHTLDLADACACAAHLAETLDAREKAERMRALAARWRNVFDPATGRMGKSKYYEGTAWNYSFRLMHDMAARIGLYPDPETFVADLDRFFGYGAAPVAQPQNPADREYLEAGARLGRFEGYNNEPDMETPYAYIYALRHDRTAEIVHAGMRFMFAAGPGGLPGNDDSGGLSSCHVWNAAGIFPVSGQPLMLIGSPLFENVTINAGGAEFEIRAARKNAADIYVQKARLNGRPLRRAWLTVDEAHAGGVLDLTMGNTPSGWDREPPPSLLGKRNRNR